MRFSPTLLVLLSILSALFVSVVSAIDDEERRVKKVAEEDELFTESNEKQPLPQQSAETSDAELDLNDTPDRQLPKKEEKEGKEVKQNYYKPYYKTAATKHFYTHGTKYYHAYYDDDYYYYGGHKGKAGNKGGQKGGIKGGGYDDYHYYDDDYYYKYKKPIYKTHPTKFKTYATSYHKYYKPYYPPYAAPVAAQKGGQKGKAGRKGR